MARTWLATGASAAAPARRCPNLARRGSASAGVLLAAAAAALCIGACCRCARAWCDGPPSRALPAGPLSGDSGAAVHVRRRGALLRRRSAGSDVPGSVAELIVARRESRWAALRDALDWTRYHLQVAILEHGTSGRSRVAAGLFERIANFHSCAGALPMEAATTGGSVDPLPDNVAERLRLAGHWCEREVAEVDVGSLHFYDVVVCVDGSASSVLAAKLRAVGKELPPHVVELGDFGAYLELRRPESPIKAWVPDWRAEVDPGYDQRQAEAQAPRDDALAVWHTVPEDLAQLIQPRYALVAQPLADIDAAASGGDGDCVGGDEDAAMLSFHLAGLVRFLMDSYPLDLQGGPGYIPP
mmetsp:Transcript_147376/g.471190  ORF Transcript_147376/g.471190 Transcript_147376/m.471190 type:complete len:356 (-) Transcript_147376:20-1087(-)